MIMSDTVAPRLICRFCSHVRDFYTTAVIYMIKNFPQHHQVLKHANILNYEARLQGDVSSAEFFINRYQTFFENFNLDILHDEFVAYKTLADLPLAIVELAMVIETKGQNFLRRILFGTTFQNSKIYLETLNFHCSQNCQKMF